MTMTASFGGPPVAEITDVTLVELVSNLTLDPRRIHLAVGIHSSHTLCDNLPVKSCRFVQDYEREDIDTCWQCYAIAQYSPA